MKLWDLTRITPHGRDGLHFAIGNLAACVTSAGYAAVMVTPRVSSAVFESDPWQLDPAYLPKTHDTSRAPVEVPSKINIIVTLDTDLPDDAHILVQPQVAITAWFLAKLGPSRCPIVTAARAGRLYSPGSPGNLMVWATAHGEG